MRKPLPIPSSTRKRPRYFSLFSRYFLRIVALCLRFARVQLASCQRLSSQAEACATILPNPTAHGAHGPEHLHRTISPVSIIGLASDSQVHPACCPSIVLP